MYGKRVRKHFFSYGMTSRYEEYLKDLLTSLVWSLQESVRLEGNTDLAETQHDLNFRLF